MFLKWNIVGSAWQAKNQNTEDKMEDKIEIERTRDNEIRIIDLRSGKSISSQSAEANLLFAIYEKLEDMKGCIIDVETAVADNKKD